MSLGTSSLDMPRSSTLRLLLGWLGVVALAIGALALYRHATLSSELERESLALLAEASQRADQHDAHLTALSAVAQAEGARESGPFKDVASTILQFYPRIDEIQLVPFDGAAPILGTSPLDPELAAALRAAGRSAGSHAALLTSPDRPGHYLMVKRSPNTDAARDGVVLFIDGARLLASDAPFWKQDNVSARLSMPDGKTISGTDAPMAGDHFSRTLRSASQPLLLDTTLSVGWRDLLLPGAALATAVAATLLYLAGLAVARQWSLTRAAERRAELADLDARLTHASRVNAMGEMASGMAHELTQPLTAILAQAQAGRRLLSAGNLPPLGGALDDVVAQARRASAILDRLRQWSKPREASPSATDLRGAVANVQALLGAEATRRGIALDIDMPEAPLVANVDQVEIEQVIFNLVRNAMEALADADEKRVTITLRGDGKDVVLDVQDTGPGVAPEVRPKLFTPFATTRPDGTGLGLALSQRLVERAGGEIGYVAPERGALFRVILPRGGGDQA